MNKKQLAVTACLIIAVVFLMIDQTAYAGRPYARWNPILSALSQAMQSNSGNQAVQQEYGGICGNCNVTYIVTSDNVNYINIQCPYCGDVESTQDVLQRYTNHIKNQKTQQRANTEFNYAGIGIEHWVSAKMEEGEYIKLEDGSLWEISSIDRINTNLWLNTEEIIVVESRNPLYPYKLINSDSGDTAEAKLISK